MSVMKEKKKKKRTALVVCRNGKQFWTTQKQFWQWVRDYAVVKTCDYPLSGVFRHQDAENIILVRHTLLNVASPIHLSEVLLSQRQIKRKVKRS